MKCPNCATKITSKHYDPDYSWYECPNCGNAYSADEIEEANNGTSPGKRAKEVKANHPVDDDEKWAEIIIGKPKKKKPASNKPVARSKKHKAGDEEALAKFEEESLKPRKAADAGTSHHRDEVPTVEILNVWADEIEAIAEETGVKVDRLNAREFFSMNIWRDLSLKHGVKARDKRITVPHCKDHA